MPPPFWETGDLIYFAALVRSISPFEVGKPIPPLTQLEMDEQDQVWKDSHEHASHWRGYEGPQLSKLDMSEAEASVVEDEW
ncbi:hypothetical protein JCM8547_003837 [Rhodosporidiobolus lusitaniae]